MRCFEFRIGAVVAWGAHARCVRCMVWRLFVMFSFPLCQLCRSAWLSAYFEPMRARFGSYGRMRLPRRAEGWPAEKSFTP